MQGYGLFFLAVFYLTACTNAPGSISTGSIDYDQLEASMVIDGQNLLGEGAIWNYRTGELYYVDIESSLMHILDPATGRHISYTTGGRVGTVVPSSDGNAVVACQHGIYRLNLTTSEMTLLADPESQNRDLRMNDGKCDPAGRLWVGSMHLEQDPYAASLYRIEPNGNYKKMLDSVTISNGITWSLDGKTMYYIDTPTRQVRGFDFDRESGDITNGHVVITVPAVLGYPDGMTIDEEGMLWIALWNGNGVSRWDPSTGRLLGTIRVPAHNVTSCAFGDEDLGTLYITSARVDMTEEERKTYPLSGGVFAVRPGVKGVRSSFFGN